MSTDKKTVRVALVGIGGYGWELLEHIRKAAPVANSVVVAAADSRMSSFPDRAEVLRRQGVELFDDALAMFQALRGKCDGVYIATSIHSHRKLAIAAAQAGLWVHLEKPAAATVQEIDEMRQAVDRAGVGCLVGFQSMHGAELQFVKERIAAGALGRVLKLSCEAGWPRDRSYYARNDWAGRLRCGNSWVLDGPATNALAHQVTNLLLLASPVPGELAEPVAVRAELYTTGDTDSHSTCAIEMTTAAGVRAYFLASHRTKDWFNPVIRMKAERADVTWSMYKDVTIRYEGGKVEQAPWDNIQHQRMIANFADAFRAGDPSMLRCPLAEARKMTVALDAAHESSRMVHLIDARHTSLADAGGEKERIIVAGLDDLIRRCAANFRLFSDEPLDQPPWVVATRPFDTAGYTQFPRSFDAEND